MILSSLLKGTDWSQITEYLSPVFFQVVSPLAIGSQIKSLSGAYFDQTRFVGVCRELSPSLRAAGLPAPTPAAAVAATTVQSAPAAQASVTAQQQAGIVLQLYFWQIYHAPTVILDLRAKAFPEQTSARAAAEAAAPGGLVWRPDPLYIRYDPDFTAQIQALYRGFYLGDDAEFTAALTALNLLQAKDLFIAHFGADQRAQRFALADFRSTFHQIFVSCKTVRARLHPNFLAFGAGLYCLYDHLETLGVPVDVRAAYFAASGVGVDPQEPAAVAAASGATTTAAAHSGGDQ